MREGTSRSRVGVALGVALALAACSHAKEESRGVTAAVERWRAAVDADKEAAADALAAAPCTDAEVCEAKRACLEVATPTVKSLALKTEVERTLAEIRAGRIARESPEAQALPGKLDEASRLLSEAASRIEPCDTRATALERKYGR